MKNRALIAGFSVLVLMVCAFSIGTFAEVKAPDATAYHKITAEEAKTMMEERASSTDDGETPFILLDVRTNEEYVEQRIEGAILIPDYEIVDRAEEELPDHDALILVYCRSGRRSALAAQALAQMGYTNVYDFGGIIDWPFDTVSDPNPNIKRVCFIKNIVTKPNIIVGEYTYYGDPEGPEAFEQHITHHYEFSGEKLIIG